MAGRPMIENSDRGITLNKQLAWTLACALVAGGIWVGTTITGLQAAQAALTSALEDIRSLVASDRQTAVQQDGQIEQRVRLIENTISRQDAQFTAFAQSLEEVKAAQREANELLRQLVRQP